MSCEFVTISSIQNLQQIRKLLFPGWEDKEDSSGNWQQLDPSWKDVTEAETTKDDALWLQECVISISPVGNVLVIANEDTIVFMTSKWDGNSENGTNEKFIVSGNESLPASEDFDGITCILCLPLASQHRSSLGRPDWTSVLIGTRLGYIKVFTDDGILLLSQKFHDEPVTEIKCRTFDPYLCAALAEQQEELTIIYKTVVVTIDGFSLYQTLRACRNQVAKARVHGNEIAPPPIAYKKWLFQDQTAFRDCESNGVIYINTFDNLMNESVKRGMYGRSSLASPAASQFVLTGHSPYLSFCYAIEGSSPLLMRDVAMAAATKLKSVITNFFGSSKEVNETSPKMQSPTPLPNRFELRDATRSGNKIYVSPNRRLSAITDEFGRVILVDNVEGIALRIWKGYRDAQIGWIEIREKESEISESNVKRPMRIANFMIIYGPRRGILEIWAMQQGPRIAAFNVEKSSRLIYCNYGILGSANVKVAKDGKLMTRHCYIIEADGLIKTISIPFHYVLSAKHGKKVRDLHLFNKLKTNLKAINLNEEEVTAEVVNIILDIKSPSIIVQALDLIISDKNCNVNVLSCALNKLKDDISTQSIDSLDFESKLLYFSCIRKLQLLKFFNDVIQLGKGESTDHFEKEEMKPLNILSDLFHLTKSEIDAVLSQLDKFNEVCTSKKCVTFEDEKCMAIGPFLLCFQSYYSHLPKDNSSIHDILLPLPIDLNTTISEAQLSALARTVFHFLNYSDVDMINVQEILIESGIDIKTLMNLLLKAWLEISGNLGDYVALSNLHSLLKFISIHEGVATDEDDIVPIWKAVRNIFSNSTNISAAYMGALACRGLAISMLTNSEFHSEEEDTKESPEKRKCSGDSSSIEWETVHLDIEQWNVLIKQLEDGIVLSTLLFCKCQTAFYSELSSFSADSFQPFSASDIFKKGKGAISELAAKWASYLQYDALIDLEILSLGDQSEDYFFFKKERTRDIKTPEYLSNISELKKIIELAKNRFPLSLNKDIWIVNCCWEFAVSWNKDKDNTQNLINSVKCLKLVSDSEYGKGLSVLVWNTFLKASFFAAAMLIEKVGKVPKDRLCRKDTGMSDSALKIFIGCCLFFLDILLQVCSVKASKRLSSFNCEEGWNHDCTNSSLVDLISLKKDPNYSLVHHHYLVAMTMHTILNFEMKSAKPLTLSSFQNGVTFLREDLDKSVFVNDQSAHSSIKDKQLKFLCRVVGMAVSAISLPQFGFENTPAQLEFFKSEQIRAIQWIRKINEIANVWELDCDHLHRHYVCELYSGGLDTLAEENLNVVADRSELGSQLILIAGQRIINAIESSKDKYVELLALFPPMITNWLDPLKQNTLRCPNPPLSLTKTMLGYILNMMPEHRTEYRYALNLIEPIDHMINVINK